MDFFTHLLIGIVLGRILFKDPNKQRAIAFGSILPDFDIIFAWIPSIFPQLFILSHRGLFHSIITLVLVSPIAIIVLQKILSYHKLEFLHKDLFIELTFYSSIIVILGSYLHLFMDLLNPQGVVLFSPITTQRYTLATMNFIEPAVSIPAALIVLYYVFIKYFKKHSISIKRFDIYSRVVSVTFVFFILLNSFFLTQTIATQQTNITTPGYLFTERWFIIDKNDFYVVKLVDQLNQQTIREFTYNKINFNKTNLNSSLVNQLLNKVQNTNEYKKYLFTLDPNARDMITVSNGTEVNQWVIEFTDIISQSQQVYFGLPQNSFFRDSIKIKISI